MSSRVLPITSEQVQAVVAKPVVQAVALTGSDRAGSGVASAASQAI
jgi:acyl-CoA reductase-like NAD-dependent aldehyde dehydrogenase